MVAGRLPVGFPLLLGEPPSVDVNRMDVLVYGIDVRFHPITKLPLENGSGALPDDEQALQIHLPHILRRDGIAAARAIYASRHLIKNEAASHEGETASPADEYPLGHPNPSAKSTAGKGQPVELFGLLPKRHVLGRTVL
jgi:hypothetical protein